MSVNHLKSKIVHFRKVCVSITDFSFTFQNKTVDIVPIIDYFAGVWGHTKHDDCS